LADEYDEKSAELGGLSEPLRKQALHELEGRCTCPVCPTYTQCAKENAELLFCFVGKSPSCITKAVKCICPTCPIEVEFAIKNMFYCTEGSEADKRRRKAERDAARGTTKR